MYRKTKDTVVDHLMRIDPKYADSRAYNMNVKLSTKEKC